MVLLPLIQREHLYAQQDNSVAVPLACYLMFPRRDLIKKDCVLDICILENGPKQAKPKPNSLPEPLARR